MTTSNPILIEGKSFVTKTEGSTATVVRTATGKNITQTEKETAGNYYNSSTNTIDYAKIYDLNFGPNFLEQMGASNEWMAQAHTNPAFKNAFKKATDKTGPNISFASIAENNLNWEPSSINKDANGKSTLNKGSGTLYYPLSKDKKEYDYLKVTAVEYVPNKFGAKDKEGNLTGGLTDDADERMNTRGIGSVFLPMQPGIKESGGVSWGQNKISGLEVAAARVAGGTIDAAEKGGAGAAAQTFLGRTGKELKNLMESVDADDVTGYFTGKAIGKNVFTRTTGKVLNPNLELLFTGPSLRSFNYAYRFTPREDAEAKMIRNIIRFFKKNMAAKREASGALFLKSPNVFRLEYIFKGGNQHPFLNKIKLCALETIDVEYTPDGNYATYDDGSMTAYQVGLGFKELNPIFDTDYNDSDNDMGY